MIGIEVAALVLIVLLDKLNLTINPIFSLNETNLHYTTVIGVTLTSYSIVLGFALNRFMKLEEILGIGAFKYVTKHTWIQHILTIMVTILIVLTSGLFFEATLPKDHIIPFTWKYIAFIITCISYTLSAPIFILSFINPLSHNPLSEFVNNISDESLLQFKYRNGISDSKDIESNEYYILKRILIHLFASNRGVLAEDLCTVISKKFRDNITPGFNECTNKLLISRTHFLESLCRDSFDQLNGESRSRALRIAFLIYLDVYSASTRIDYQYSQTLLPSTDLGLWKYFHGLTNNHCSENIKLTFKSATHLYLSTTKEAVLESIINKLEDAVFSSSPDILNKYFWDLGELIIKIAENNSLDEEVKYHHIKILSTVSHGMDSYIIRNEGWPASISPFLISEINDICFMPPYLIKNEDANKEIRQKVAQIWLESVANLTLRTIRYGMLPIKYIDVLTLYKRTSNDHFEKSYEYTWKIRGFILNWYVEILKHIKERCPAKFLDFYSKGNQNLCKMLCDIKEDKTAPKELIKRAKKFNEILSKFRKEHNIRDKWCNDLFPPEKSLKRESNRTIQD